MAAKAKSAKTASDKDAKAGRAPVLAVHNVGDDIDTVVHERTRLAIVSALAVNKRLSFQDIKAQLRISDGNLSAHARKLEDAGYITCTKGFTGRMPKTEFQLTAAGRRALKKYIAHMEALIKVMKQA